FLGRASLALALQRFAQEGAWGVSPHLIPHRSLHSISGTVSQALGIHGPNFGVGGGPHGAAEGVLAATGLLSEGYLPAGWVGVTGWDREPVVEDAVVWSRDGPRPADSCYIAAAMALTPWAPGWPGTRLRVHPEGVATATTRMPKRTPAGAISLFRLEALLEVLEGG